VKIAQGATIFVFDAYELDLGLHELRRDGVAQTIEPQVFDLLVFLVINRDRLVSRNELIEQIWGGRIVSDAALSTAMKSARQAIGDSGKAQDLIRTVPRQGFRFVGEIQGEVAGVQLTPSQEAGVVAKLNRNSIAAGLIVLVIVIVMGGAAYWWTQPVT